MRTGPFGYRLRIAVSAALLLLVCVAQPVAAIMVASSFPTGTGFHVFGFDPVHGTFDLYPGVAFEFRTHSLSAPLDSIRVSLNQFVGANDMLIGLHEAEPYVDNFGVSTIRPGRMIESFHLQDALTAASQIVTVQSVLTPLLQQDTSYFISVSAVNNGQQRQLIRWSLGDGDEIPIIGESDEGLVRAFLSSTGWGTYQYSGFPRGAFEVIGAPEPGAGALLGVGLVLLAVRSRRVS